MDKFVTVSTPGCVVAAARLAYVGATATRRESPTDFRKGRTLDTMASTTMGDRIEQARCAKGFDVWPNEDCKTGYPKAEPDKEHRS